MTKTITAFPMTLGSLFDGSGTCPLAAQTVGITPVWASEIEPFPVAVTKSRFPDMLHLGDVTKLDGAEIPPVDVIAFGSPCTDLSNAKGSREGLAGKESGLFFEAIRIIQEMRCATDEQFPKYVLFENVPGVFSSNGGEDFRIILQELCQTTDPHADIPGSQKWPKAGLILGERYSLAWRCLDAQFWGVSQRRKRLFAVLDLGGQRAAEILFERKSLQRDYSQSLGAWQTAPAALDDRPDEHHSGYAVENHGKAGRYTLNTPDVVQTLAARMGTGGNNVPLLICRATSQAGAESCYDLAPTLTGAAGTSGNNQPFATVPMVLNDQGGKMMSVSEDMTATLRAQEHGHQPIITVPIVFNGGAGSKAKGIGISTEASPTLRAGSSGLQAPCVALPVAFSQQHYSDYKESEVAATMKATGGILDGGSETLISDPQAQQDDRVLYLVRKLTPAECAALQGFPKDWCSLVEHRDAAEYKMWGNGMAFPCILYIMEGIKLALEKQYKEMED